ncbi:hypothetical protein F2Q69_00063030 [Brassica cretica]|uniref:F-box domain-containing protein n=1 Tax=Brassica cretica TaxID=69181 RepID=A0A8S9RJY3_BRACR|nr:hypothetical protein F2Q69_00063030 [Brassica cretica]
MNTAKDLIKKKKIQGVVSSTDWSKLSPDVLRKIFETLNPLDSHRSKLVCSDWYSVWKTCDNLPPCPLQGKGSGFMDAAYRNSKLYVLTVDKHINIFDFSLDLPRKCNLCKYTPFRFDEKPWESIWKTRLAIKESGDNEMLIFGQGVTVKAPVKDCFGHGIKSGSINFVEDDVGPDHDDDDHGSVCGVFDLATSRIEWPKRTCYYISRTQWFVPGVVYY